MGFVSNVVCGAAGYVIGRESKSGDSLINKVADRFQRSSASEVDLREAIKKIAEMRGIYTCNNEFAHELIKIAETYKEYDYDMRY
jgi:hypothetical protein